MDRQLRVTDDVCEQQMRDFELDLFFNLGGHICVPTGISERYALDSTADSREQSQKASFVRSPRNFESDACARTARILLELSACRAVVLRPRDAGGLNVGRFHPK